MRKKYQNNFQLPLMMLGIMVVIWGSYAAISGSYSLILHSKNSSRLNSLGTAEELVGQDLNQAFLTVQESLSSSDSELIKLVVQGQNIGQEAEPLLKKIGPIYDGLKPHMDRITREIAAINSQLAERSFKIEMDKDTDRMGVLTIPLVEGLLAEYGPTEHRNGILVSAEKDDFGNLPLTEGVSYREAPKLLAEFERLKLTSEYNKTTELAHASFIRNWSKYGCNWDLKAQCRPDTNQVAQNNEWFKRIKREVAVLRAKLKAFDGIRQVALQLEKTHNILKERLELSEINNAESDASASASASSGVGSGS